MKDARGHVGGAESGRAAGPPKGGPAAPLAWACRGAMYQALALGFSEPSAAYAEALCDGELVAGLREAAACITSGSRYEAALSTLTQAMVTAAHAGPGPALEQLCVEHARLFTGPGRPAVQCYASQYLNADERGPGRLNGEAAALAAAAYTAEAVALSPRLGELPDHITVELEFLFYLCRVEEQTLERGHAEAAQRLLDSYDSFLRRQAAPWMPAFADAARAATEHGLYDGLAELLAAHVAVELGESGLNSAEPGAG